MTDIDHPNSVSNDNSIYKDHLNMLDNISMEDTLNILENLSKDNASMASMNMSTPEEESWDSTIDM